MITIGVLLTTALVLAAVSVLIELKIFYSTPWLKKLVGLSVIVGIAMSLALSWVLGLLFGASGLIVLLAGTISTAITEPIHAWKRKQSKRKDKVHSSIKEFADTWRPVGKLIKYAFLLVTSPLWVPVKIRRWWLDRQEPKPTTQRVRIKVDPSNYTTAS